MIGIVGNGRDKFTDKGYVLAEQKVLEIINSYPQEQVCSGDSPLGGVDYLAKKLTPKDRYVNYPPIKTNPWRITSWDNGFRDRNLKIAQSRIVFVVVADVYPENFPKEERFGDCYHCLRMGRNSKNHIKSGACWTAMEALKNGNQAEWIIIPNYSLQSSLI